MLNPSLSGEGYTHNLCNALQDAGCDVALYTGPHFLRVSRGWGRIAYNPCIRFYRFTQLRSYHEGAGRIFWRILRLLGHLWAMSRVVIDAPKFDVVHVQFLPVPRLDVWVLLLIGHRCRVLYTVHNLYPHGADGSGRARRLYARIYRRAHHLIAHTEFTVRGLVGEFGVDPSKISRVPHGNFSHLRAQSRPTPPKALGLDPTGSPIVLLLGQLRPNKGIDVLVEAVGELRQRQVAFTLIIAGAPRMDLAPIRARIRELGLQDGVQLRPGYIEEEAVSAYFASAAVVALPYRTIDQSGVAIAAMSMGRAVVATRIAGLEKLVSAAHCGLLVPVDDPLALAAALERILTERELRERFETNARRYTDSELSWSRVAARTLDVYTSVAIPVFSS